jgi:alkaline phosphatase
MEFDAVDFRQPSLVPLGEATHEGSDVGVYATGVNAHLFTGVYEQHYIAHAMMYATCLGPENFLKAPSCSAAVKFSVEFALLFSGLMAVFIL